MSLNQLELWLNIDSGAYDQKRGRKTRPSRHTTLNRQPDKLACGHKGLPTDGDFMQLPITFEAIYQLVDCHTCRHYLAAIAIMVTIRGMGRRAASTPVDNMGVNSMNEGERGV